jgi:hypothetical protein
LWRHGRHRVEVAPGFGTVLRVSLSLKGKSGRVEKSVYVASNDPRNPYLQLRLSGEAITTLSVLPRGVLFGVVTNGLPATRRVTLASGRVARMTFTNVTCASPFFSASFVTNTAGYAVLAVQAKPPPSAGVVQAEVVVGTDSAATPRIVIPVSAEVVQDLSVTPHVLMLMEDSRIPETRLLAIRSAHGTPFRIVRVEPPGNAIHAAVRPIAGGGFQIELSGILPEKGLEGQSVAIWTDHPETPCIRIPVRMIRRGGSLTPLTPPTTSKVASPTLGAQHTLSATLSTTTAAWPPCKPGATRTPRPTLRVGYTTPPPAF